MLNSIKARIRWNVLLAVFKLRRIAGRILGTRALDYPKAKLKLVTTTLREYETRANSVAKEPDTVLWVEKVSGEGKVFFDIGANVGAYSLIAAVRGMDVYAFEPAHYNSASLGENVFLNNLETKVTQVPIVVGASAGRAQFPINDRTAGSSRGFYRGAPPEGKGGAARYASFVVARLDDVVSSLGMPMPSAIKIDVDGGEVDVLRGAAKTLGAPQLTDVVVESDDSNKVTVVELMASAGFSVVREVRMDKKTVNMFFERK